MSMSVGVFGPIVKAPTEIDEIKEFMGVKIDDNPHPSGCVLSSMESPTA